MPELPEVEATRRYLVSQGLVGRRVVGVKLSWPRAVREPSAAQFRRQIAGRRIEEIRRRAKYLLVDLDGTGHRVLIMHLRMTGALVVGTPGDPRPRHTRNVLLLDRGGELCFVDPRKLGAMWLVGDEEEVLSGLGPEPLEGGFTPALLAERLSKRAAPVKALLCDQGIVAGVGNIYADDALFVAGIHPLRPAGELSADEVEGLHRAIVTRLREATEALVPLVEGGGPPTESEAGHELLLVPRHHGGPCGRCGGPVDRVVVRGRSSFYCPICQAA